MPRRRTARRRPAVKRTPKPRKPRSPEPFVLPGEITQMKLDGRMVAHVVPSPARTRTVQIAPRVERVPVFMGRGRNRRFARYDYQDRETVQRHDFPNMIFVPVYTKRGSFVTLAVAEWAGTELPTDLKTFLEGYVKMYGGSNVSGEEGSVCLGSAERKVQRKEVSAVDAFWLSRFDHPNFKFDVKYSGLSWIDLISSFN